MASLIHDDVIDASETRRGSDTVQHRWGQKKVSERYSFNVIDKFSIPCLSSDRAAPLTLIPRMSQLPSPSLPPCPEHIVHDIALYDVMI